MMTRKLLWFIPVFLLCTLIVQPSYAVGDPDRDIGGLPVPANNEGNTPPSSSTVQTYWDTAFKEMCIQTTANAGNIQAAIQGNGQTVYNQTITPASFVMISLWQTPAGAYKLTLTDSKGTQMTFSFTLN